VSADVRFPLMSHDAPDAQGVVARWYVREGEDVLVDQVVAEVQLDKVDVEVLAPAAGRIHLTVPEGAEVGQGSTIATVM
jgi:pyruvate/2-oxoglutarate dehydrogenase complex dihydrolipoamide acyltransferase (E2) component